MLFRMLVTLMVGAALTGGTAHAQAINARERALPSYDAGLQHMRGEDFPAAIQAFEAATKIDPSYDMAFYMLGRVHLMEKNYASAVSALTTCRDLHISAGTRQFTNKQELQRIRRDRIEEVERYISELQRNIPTGDSILEQNRRRQLQEQIRQFQERKRQLEDQERNEDLTPAKLVPGFVSLSLGSAYFRSGKLADAEIAYLAAVAADPKIGEAHNNLAVVYMETGRLAEAEKSVKAAEKAGLRVSPALKDEIKKRKK